MRYVTLIAVALLAGCARSEGIYTPSSTIMDGYALDNRASTLTLAIACGAEPARVIDFAENDQIPRNMSPKAAITYRKTLTERLRTERRTLTYDHYGDACLALRRTADVAPLWQPDLAKLTKAQRDAVRAEQATYEAAETARKVRAEQVATAMQERRKLLAQCEYEAMLGTVSMRDTLLGLEKAATQNKLRRLCLQAHGAE